VQGGNLHMNKLHEKIKLEYWQHKESSYYWKEIYTNRLWEIFKQDGLFEFNRFIENKDDKGIRLSTYELDDDSYINEFRYELLSLDENVGKYKGFFIDDLMWLKFYDYKDKHELYISVDIKTLEAKVYTEVTPLMILLLGI
jgi:hypothetical protein